MELHHLGPRKRGLVMWMRLLKTSPTQKPPSKNSKNDGCKSGKTAEAVLDFGCRRMAAHLALVLTSLRFSSARSWHLCFLHPAKRFLMTTPIPPLPPMLTTGPGAQRPARRFLHMTSAASDRATGPSPPAPPTLLILTSPHRTTAVDDLDEAQAAVELEMLAKELLHHDKLYYEGGASGDEGFMEGGAALPDAAYDALARREVELEDRFPHLARPDGRRRRVGPGPNSAGGKGGGGLSPASPHLQPMLSLDNAIGEGDLARFVERLVRSLADGGARGFPGGEAPAFVDLVAEPKIDGLSLALR